MDQISSMVRDLEVDLENGSRTASKEDGGRDPVLGNMLANKPFSGEYNEVFSFNGSVKDENGVSLTDNSVKSGSTTNMNVELLIDVGSRGEESQKSSNLAKKKHMNEKHKKANPRKPPKPPRPPKGPSLDAADQKFVREISELAVRRRARIERIKELKRKKVAKALSKSNSGLSAMIITLLFFIVIVFQGICSRASSSKAFQGSSEAATATRKTLISVQYQKTPPSSKSSELGSSILNTVEQHVADLKGLMDRVYG